MINKTIFCERLIEIVPEFRELVDDESVGDEGEPNGKWIMLHGVMPRVLDYMLERLKNHGPKDEMLIKLLNCVEHAWAERDEQIDDGVGASFLLSLFYDRDDPYPAELITMLGPTLTEDFRCMKNS